jgi:hypothetical protein
MRTGPFSDPRVIERLNAYFVPVYAVNEDYHGDGLAPPEERAEYQRIYREAHAARFSVGTVHVYILDPDGKPVGTLHVAEAAKTDRLLALMDRVVKEEGLAAGKPLVAPQPQSCPPPGKPDDLVLHLTARPLKPGGSWPGVAENWILYTPEEVARLLPKGAVRPGDRWTPDAELAKRLLLHFYPVTENNDVRKNRIEEQELSARVLSVEGGVVRARLDGRLRMRHWFYHKEDNNVVLASFSGYVEFEAEGRKVRSLKLATVEAAYGGGTFGVAVRSLPF